MTRGLSAPQVTAVRQSHRIVVPLLELYYRDLTLRLAVWDWDIVIGSDTYLHTAGLMSVEPLSESDQSLEGLQFSMSGLNASIIVLAADSAQYRGRVARTLKAYLNPDTNAVIGAPVVQFLGRMRNHLIEDTNTTSKVTVQVEHYEAELGRAAPRRMNDADQQRDYPGDRGCEYADTMADKSITWPSSQALKK